MRTGGCRATAATATSVPRCAWVLMGYVVLWDAVRAHLLTSLLPYSVCVNRKLCSDMSGARRHPDGPDTDLLVSLHKLLQAGQRSDATAPHGRELQLRLPRLPPLH